MKLKKWESKISLAKVVLVFFFLVLSPSFAFAEIEIIKERTLPSNAIGTMSATNEPQKRVYEVKNVTMNEYEDLKTDKGIRVQKNYKVTTFLDDSTGIIGADDTWQREIAGSNIKGQGQTICVIDTGVDYTHSAFGGCDPEFSTNEVEFSMQESGSGTHDINIKGIEAVSLHFSDVTGEIEIIYEDYLYETMDSAGESSVIPSDDGLEIRVPEDSSEFTISYATNHSASWDDCERVEGGFDFVDRSIDPDDDNDPEKNGGHGTHVAGIAAGNDGTITGVAPEANIYIIKVLGEEGGSFADINMAIKECAKNAEEHGISSIVMSLGTEEYKNSYYCDSHFVITANEIDYATSKGITVAVATGNEGETDSISSPACIESSTRVGATDKNDNIWDSTNRGGNFDDILMAPGVSIESSVPWGYEHYQGTSMAAPHVAGAAALIRQTENLNGEDYTNDDIFHSLNSTGETIYDSSSEKDYTRINVDEAIDYFETNFTKSIAKASESEVKVGRTRTYDKESELGQANANGGDVTVIDLSSSKSTNKWQGYFGSTKGSLTLGFEDELFYDFGEQKGKYVYATMSDSIFEEIHQIKAQEIDDYWGLGNNQDSAENVYNKGYKGHIAAKTKGGFTTFVTATTKEPEQKEDFVFAGVISENKEGFNNEIHNYEMLVPSTNQEKYFFFMEL